jgi:hypothetical protein
MHDRGAWDGYWKHHLKRGPMEVAFGDMMASDPTLPALLTRRRARTILCAGCGLSFEPISLALHGFDVTALDLSGVPAERFAAKLQEPGWALHQVPGVEVHDDVSIVFVGSGPIDPELCPRIHASTDCLPKKGGSLAYVTGDLTDPEVCPGPFDVVIERRTLQLFRGDEQTEALGRLVARLASPGAFVSHHHDGWWRPGRGELKHYARDWLESQGFVLRFGQSDPGPVCRLACLMLSTG